MKKNKTKPKCLERQIHRVLAFLMLVMLAQTNEEPKSSKKIHRKSFLSKIKEVLENDRNSEISSLDQFRGRLLSNRSVIKGVPCSVKNCELCLNTTEPLKCIQCETGYHLPSNSTPQEEQDKINRVACIPNNSSCRIFNSTTKFCEVCDYGYKKFKPDTTSLLDQESRLLTQKVAKRHQKTSEKGSKSHLIIQIPNMERFQETEEDSGSYCVKKIAAVSREVILVIFLSLAAFFISVTCRVFYTLDESTALSNHIRQKYEDWKKMRAL